MKNGLLIWNVVLTLIAGYLLFTYFSSKKKEADPVKTLATNPVPVNSAVRIAYFDMDSVENNFNMVKKARLEIDDREKQYNNEVTQLEMNKAQKVEGYRKQNLTQEEIEKARMDIAQQEEYNKQKRQELFQELQDFINKKQLYLQNLIKEFLREYNKDNTYSYIFSNEHGLFYYCDTTYNITRDIISKLNDRYKKDFAESNSKLPGK